VSEGAIVVTGGTGGLGRTVVARLLAKGDRVAVPYRDPEAFEGLRAAVKTGGALWGAPADLSQPESAERFFAAARREVGRLSGLAALAGAWAGSGSFEKAPEDEWTRMLSANLETARIACRAALPHLLESGGSAVLVGAVAALRGGEGAAAYAVAKAGVVTLGRVLAEENRGRGVRFNVVAPGTIDTPANRKAMPQADRRSWVGAEALAELIAFLLNPASAPLTGAVLPVEGPGK
jgi:NAD(P)-dependent dehydrogenase (short-subunit alcohol dehydrogenase family)